MTDKIQLNIMEAKEIYSRAFNVPAVPLMGFDKMCTEAYNEKGRKWFLRTLADIRKRGNK